MKRRSTRLGRRTGPCRPLLSLAVLALVPACADETTPGEEVSADAAPEPERVSVVPARYATEVAFVGFAAEPLRLYARFVNETTESALERRYSGWLESAGTWQALGGLRDRLPVPRGAWRVLPGGAWRVMAADGGELAGLIYRDSLTEFRLTPGELVAEWTGETGQREALLLARVQHGDSLQNGLLVLRRSARLRRDGAAPPPPGSDSRPEGAGDRAVPSVPAVGLRTQLFLLVDSLSNGLLVARDASDPDANAIAWTWVGTIGNEWTDVRVRPPPEGASRALARWQIELPEAGVTARFRLQDLPPLSPDDSIVGERNPRPYSLSGRLEILGGGRPASGLGVESRS